MRIIKNPIFMFTLGAIIFGSIGVYAAKEIFASNVSYEPSDTTWKKANGEDITNVSDAIDELYNKAKSKPNIINLNGTSSVRSQESHTYDVSYIEGYENFTADNFLYSFISLRWVGNANGIDPTNINYDNITGIVTFPATIGGGNGTMLDIEYYPILVY